jgi:DNA-directed RNA polymerase delta subunit
MNEKIREWVHVDEIRKVLFYTETLTNGRYFLLGDLMNELKSAYPDKETNVQVVRAYLSQIELTGMLEKSRSGVGLDKKYWWNKPV